MKIQWEPDKELDELASRVLGAAIEVHRTLGPGFKEMVYELALAHELGLKGIRHSREHFVPIVYKGLSIGRKRLDLLVEERLILELKSVDGLDIAHQAQVISYLRLTNLNLGLLINFNVPILKNGIRRVVLPPKSWSE